MIDKNNDITDISFTLKVQSNVDYPTTINVLGNPFNPLDTSNATTQYLWNLTSFAFTNENLVQIQYKTNNATNYSLFSTTLAAQNLQSVITSLNTLGQGFFNTYTQSGSTFITTYNNNITFGLLNIYSNTIPYLTYSWNLSGGGGKAEILVNAVPQVTDTSPIVTSGNVTLANGNLVQFNQGATTSTTTFSVYNLTTQTYLSQIVRPPGTNGSFTFTSQSGNSYYLTAQD